MKKSLNTCLNGLVLWVVINGLCGLALLARVIYRHVYP